MYKSIIISIILIIVVSCNTKTPSKLEGLEEIQQRNVTIVESMFEHFNKHDWQKMASLYADTALFQDPSFGEKQAVRQTHQEIVEKYSALQKQVPNIHDKIVGIYPSGDRHVGVEFIASGGSATDSSYFELPICSFITIENGKIVRDNTYYDNQ